MLSKVKMKYCEGNLHEKAIIATVLSNISPEGNSAKWRSAMDGLVASGANLMKTLGELLSATESATIIEMSHGMCLIITEGI